VLAGLGLAVATGRFGAQAEPVIYPNGVASCTCINPWGETNFSSDAGTALLATSSCRNASHAGQNENGPHTSCLPADFGEKCKSWDQLLSPECVDASGNAPDSGQPGFCGRSWCYVNAKTCKRPFYRSQMEWPGVTGLPVAGLGYSYETCGNLGFYTSEKHFKDLRNKRLRVSYPGDSGTGYTLLTHKDGEKKGQKDGSFVQFARQMALDAGFTWEVRNVSKASKSRYSSSFTACVHDIALGETDLCIGNFWTTPERLLLTSFTPALYEDEFRLIAPMSAKPDFVQILLGPFKPFTVSAWTWITILVFFQSIAMSVLEPEEIDHDELTLADHIAQRLGLNIHDKPFLHFIDSELSWMVKCVWQSVMSFTSGAPVLETTTFPGRLVSLGFSVFGLVVLTAYTAALAAGLAVPPGGGPIQGLADVIATGKPLCIMNAIAPSFDLRYNYSGTQSWSQAGMLKTADSSKPLLEMVNSGQCAAALMYTDSWKRELVVNPTVACSNVAVGPTILSAGNAMPVSSQYEMQISFLVAQHLSAGGYHSLRSSYQAEYVGLPQCDTAADADADFVQLTEMDLFAPLIITFLGTTIGLLVYVVAGYSDTGFRVRHMPKAGVKIRKEVAVMSIAALIEVANQSVEDGVTPQGIVDGALDKLPNRTELLHLCYTLRCPSEQRDNLLIQEMNLTELYERAVETASLPVGTLGRVAPHQLDEAANHGKDPKDAVRKLLFIEELEKEKEVSGEEDGEMANPLSQVFEKEV
jgi:hypothetical protein